MRLVGTGKDPDNKYPEGLVFDVPPHVAAKVVEEGYGTYQNPKDDAGRTESQIAAAVERGDSLSDPTDRELAGEFRGEGNDPAEGKDPYEVVQGASVDEPVDGGPVARAPVGTVTPVGGPAPVAASAPESASTSAEPKPLTSKQRAVIAAEELGIDAEGTEAEIRDRISEEVEGSGEGAEGTSGDAGEGEGSAS